MESVGKKKTGRRGKRPNSSVLRIGPGGRTRLANRVRARNQTERLFWKRYICPLSRTGRSKHEEVKERGAHLEREGAPLPGGWEVSDGKKNKTGGKNQARFASNSEKRHGGGPGESRGGERSPSVST